MSTERRRFTRRGFVATSAISTASAATVGVAVLGGPGKAVFAQTTDEATPVPLPDGPITDVTIDTGDWRSTNGDNTGQRAAKTKIDGSNVTTLGPAWRIDLTDADGKPAAVTGTPIIVGDLVYIQDMNSNVTAYDRASGKVKWAKTYNLGCNGPNGVTYGYGNLFFGLGESAEVAAINAKTGDDVWRVKLSNMKEEGIRMSPVAYGGIVYVSIVPLSTNNNPGSHGILHALDAQTGNTIWYFDLSVDNLWGNARKNMGAGLWYAPNFDEKGNLYFGNGNAAPWPGDEQDPEGGTRHNANLYASTAMSVDPTDGTVRWYFQPQPFDLTDGDYQIAPMIVQATINGVDTKVAICAGKTGDVVAIDADNGNMLWWTKVGKHENDLLQELTDEYIQVFPGGNGGVLTPPAYADGVYYCVITNRPSWVNATGSESHPEDPFEGEVIAIDVPTGNILWDVYVPTFPTGSIIVANDQVITAGLDGLIRAFNRKDGTQSWNFQLKAGVNAPVAIAGDELYVAAGTQYEPAPDQITEQVAATATYELIKLTLGPGGGVVPSPAAPKINAAQASDATPAATAANVAPVTPEADSKGVLRILVEAGDLYFKPNALAIPANNDVKLTVRNVGALQHDFVIEKPPVDSGMIASGNSVELNLNLAPGTYQFLCTVEGHADAGMIGTITAE
ncbi:MAG TPA: PQQ-binding-like beta-propeller repeat protein [Thermomicrobiales bacterium]|nr:PQQ-binding-like beta-propeller repeat protein [Thermomicrobiales bacterium]